jgi:hypothetical protein
MTLLHAIESAGFTVALNGDKLTVAPASRLTADQREKLRANRERIISELAARSSRGLDRAALQRPPPLSRAGWTWTDADEEAAVAWEVELWRQRRASSSVGRANPAADGGLYAGP